MHFEENGFKTFPAGQDFTNSDTVTQPQYLAVKLNASGQIVATSAVTDKCIGTLFDVPKLGMPGQVRLLSAAGTSNVQAGGTVNPGDYLTLDANGHAITTTATAQNLIGQSLEAGVTGQILEFIPVGPAVHS